MSEDGSLRQWRRARRTELLEQRIAAGEEQRTIWNDVIAASVRALLSREQDVAVAFYWPFRGEFDARPLMRDLHAQGIRLALPAVVEPSAPLEFRLWQPNAEMIPGAYKIPVPKVRHTLLPAVVVAPLVGFDTAGYRLGYGGGYYDRTLAALSPKPFVIGVGFEMSKLDTIYPQPRDIPMNVIVTEAKVYDYREQ